MSKRKVFYIKVTSQKKDLEGHPMSTVSCNYFIKENDLDTEEGLNDCLKWLKDETKSDTFCIDFIWRLK
jgi:hypothetical protein